MRHLHLMSHRHLWVFAAKTDLPHCRLWMLSPMSVHGATTLSGAQVRNMGIILSRFLTLSTKSNQSYLSNISQISSLSFHSYSTILSHMYYCHGLLFLYFQSCPLLTLPNLQPEEPFYNTDPINGCSSTLKILSGSQCSCGVLSGMDRRAGPHNPSFQLLGGSMLWETRWSLPTAAPITHSLPLAEGDGNIYIGDQNSPYSKITVL